MAKCSKYHAKCKVTMPKCCKYHAKWQVLVPNCCKYKANGTGKKAKKHSKTWGKKKQQVFYTLYNYTKCHMQMSVKKSPLPPTHPHLPIGRLLFDMISTCGAPLAGPNAFKRHLGSVGAGWAFSCWFKCWNGRDNLIAWVSCQCHRRWPGVKWIWWCVLWIGKIHQNPI